MNIKKGSMYLTWLVDTIWTEIVKGVFAHSWYVVNYYADFAGRVLARVKQ